MRVNNILLSISATLAIASMTGCSGGSDSSNTSSVPSAPIIEVETAKVISDELPTYLEVTGNLSGDEQSDVAPAIGGKIAEVRFDIGSFVKKGELLVRLDSKDAEIRLDQSKKAVDQAVANLRQTQSRLGVVDGEVFDIERFSQVRSVRAQLDLAEKELERATRLRASGDISQSAFDMRKSQRDALLGQLDEARSNAAVAVKAIETAFGSFDAFKASFADAATKRFGSGWAWLVVDQGVLKVTSTANQDSPLMQGQTPILGLDVWEHAYYLHYQNRRPDYISAFWNVVNWPQVAEYFAKAK